jgi:hypothetical protein
MISQLRQVAHHRDQLIIEERNRAAAEAAELAAAEAEPPLITADDAG